MEGKIRGEMDGLWLEPIEVTMKCREEEVNFLLSLHPPDYKLDNHQVRGIGKQIKILGDRMLNAQLATWSKEGLSVDGLDKALSNPTFPLPDNTFEEVLSYISTDESVDLIGKKRYAIFLHPTAMEWLRLLATVNGYSVGEFIEQSLKPLGIPDENSLEWLKSRRVAGTRGLTWTDTIAPKPCLTT